MLPVTPWLVKNPDPNRNPRLQIGRHRPVRALPQILIGSQRVLAATALTTAALSPDPTHNSDDVMGASSSSSSTQAAQLIDPQFARNEEPRRLVQLASEQQGQVILSRLAVGDQNALADCGVTTQGPYDTQVHEWGLGRDAQDNYWLVAGGPGMVDWAQPALQGLSSIAHTHPRHAINGQAFAQEMGLTAQPLTVAAALNAWLPTGLPLGYMPGDVWYLFPSNQDLGAAYYTSHQVNEVVYTPFRLGADGWLSAAEGPTLGVRFGPVYASLKGDAADLIAAKQPRPEPTDADSMKQVEQDCLQFLGAPLTFLPFQDGQEGPPIGTGYLQVDPLQGKSGESPEAAWFRPNPMGGMRSRAEVHDFIRTTLEAPH